MSNIVSKHSDKLFIECSCGCSIISIFNIEGDRWYLQHYGYCEDEQCDFELTTADMWSICDAIRKSISYCENSHAQSNFDFAEIECGFIDNPNDKECLSITADNCGELQILKYHKNYHKFLKHHEENIENRSNEIIEYKKCKCDWDICIPTSLGTEIVNGLEELIKQSVNN